MLRALLTVWTIILSQKNNTLFLSCFHFFPTFSADPKPKKNPRVAFPIPLHSVMNRNGGKIVALPSLFPNIWC